MQVLSSPASARLKALYPVDYSVSKQNKPDNIPATDRVTIRFAGNIDSTEKEKADQLVQSYLSATTPETRTIWHEKARKELGKSPLELAQLYPPFVKPEESNLKPNHLYISNFYWRHHGEIFDGEILAERGEKTNSYYVFDLKKGAIDDGGRYKSYDGSKYNDDQSKKLDRIPTKIEINLTLDKRYWSNGIHLTDVRMHDFDVKNGEWRNAVLQNVHLADNVFRDVLFNHFWAENNDFKDVSFPDTIFENFYLAGNQFEKVNFCKTHFKKGFIAHNDFKNCDFYQATFENVCFVDSDFSTARHLGKAEFKDCTYLEGHEPIFPNDVSPETLGILKEKDPSRHPRLSLPQNPNYLSHISHRDFLTLPDEETKQLFSHLAQQKRIPLFQTSSSHTRDTLRKLRESFRPKLEESNLSFYEPPVRNPRQSGESEIINLRLETYPLTTKDGNLYFDLNEIKDACLAQQLYSMAYQALNNRQSRPNSTSSQDEKFIELAQALVQSLNSFSDSIQAAYWMKCLLQAYGQDFNRAHDNGDHWEVSQEWQQEFLIWLKKRYRLYEGEFNLKKTLQAILPPGKLDGFTAVTGSEDKKEQLIQQIIAPLIFPAVNAFADSAPARGWSFYGPPGTGKSFIGKQLSRQFGLKPVVVTLSSIGSGYENQTIQNLREQFEKALRLAKRHGVSVMLLDEMDQIGSHRKKAGSGSKADLGNALLNNITEYIEEGEIPIIVIGTTNSLRNIDPALRRSKRLGNELEIGLPDQASRRAFLEQALPQPNPFLKHNPYEGGRNKLIEFAADKSRGLSVGDLSQLIDNLTTGYHRSITQQHVLQEIKAIQEKKRAEIDKKVDTPS